ncbi:choline ABC transporter ATP-binding protein [Saccharospirillum salsuginis]|uniref:Choline ABC transporter ATP-binding protein n=1 Tax=Saccharospirillum salsuginis TaxID=418750 RepID=A0A918NDS2_9GAMM|nr:choline ABC transporter ATP-binding protein [Saccharospirillum salsuginis]GGX62916.1 choline ABC transporter ATP-binding protein [Saccharospirillum salsuginis]
MIEFKNVDLVFGKKTDRALPLLDQGYDRERLLDETGLVLGVRDANLKVNKGEICVLMGLSGSGKSSLIRCVNGLNDVTRGEVLIEHHGETLDFFKADAETQREIRMKRISMVFQRFALMPWLTVAENVAFALDVQKLPKDEIERRVSEQLAIVGLTEWRDHKPSALSGGMQQRVGLARALATESDILLMDEPFSALDPLIRQQLQEELLQLQEKLQKTIIFVSHDLDEALKLGNTIAIMKDGCIVQQGKPQDIVLRPATDYVKDFVAHTNPLHVLRCGDIAQPLTDHPQRDGRYCIDEKQDCWYDAAGQQLYQGSQAVALQRWQTGESMDALHAQPTLVDAGCTFKDALEIRYRTGYAVLVTDGAGETRVIGDRELYRGLLGQAA